MTKKVLITCPPMLKQVSEFQGEFAQQGWDVSLPNVVQTLTEDELVELVPAHDGWIIGDDPATARVLEAGVAGRLRGCVKWGVGVDNVDRTAMARLGLHFTNTPQMFGEEVADVAIGYLIGLSRHLFEIDRAVRSNNWHKPPGRSLSGKRIGIVGYGDNGRNFVLRGIHFGLQIVVYDPAVAASTTLPHGAELAEWPARVGELDYLIFACSLNAANRHMLNESVLSSVQRGLGIINVARGPLIDEHALVRALGDGRVGPCALDVFEDEPLPADSPLRRFDRVVLGSHNSSNTVEAVLRASRRAIQHMSDFLREAS